jgi:hypothetical protein
VGAQLEPPSIRLGHVAATPAGSAPSFQRR